MTPEWAVLIMVIGTALMGAGLGIFLYVWKTGGPSDEEILLNAQRAYLQQEVRQAVDEYKIPGTVPYDIELETPTYSMHLTAEIPGTDASVIARIFVQQILLNDYTLRTHAWWETEEDDA